jgi:hypothetical protein
MVSDPGDGLHRNIAAEETASNAVVVAVSDLKDVDMTDLDPLTRTIDSGALDAVYDTMGPDGSVSFEYEGFEVLVSGDGIVSVRPADDE